MTTQDIGHWQFTRIADYVAGLQAEIAALRNKNARLMAAMTKIDEDIGPEDYDYSSCTQWQTVVARWALAAVRDD